MNSGLTTSPGESPHRDEATALADHQRRQIARELHDTLAQQISAIGLLTEGLQRCASSSEASAIANHIAQCVATSKRQLSSLSLALQVISAEPLALNSALSELAASTEREHGVDCRFWGDAELSVDDPHTANQLFMISLEAVQNALRHARASEIAIRLERGVDLQLTIVDNGQGMPQTFAEAGSSGIRAMRSRCNAAGGEFQFESRPNEGVMIRCRVPTTSRSTP